MNSKYEQLTESWKQNNVLLCCNWTQQKETMMLQSNYLICFDGLVLVPRPAPLLVVNKKLKQDLKKEKIGDSERRARCGDAPPVFGGKSGWKVSQIGPKMTLIARKMEAKNGLRKRYRFESLRDSIFSVFWCQKGSKKGKELHPTLHNLETAAENLQKLRFFHDFEGSSVGLLDRKGSEKEAKTKSKQDLHGWLFFW